ncbi:choline transporter-like protein 4 isoform X1 [Cricetulus griseus]|uniref:Choline transporter-like protein n=1 Tax=Cricetulus griseus TaxID=10029 RepID=A0A9J7EW54_CRIGR|nr:choline transporter-like protein 4 isoform X1 [Cricetulus griseus]XP_027244612.1 choline transporter-like protein 4 isoform X1 [Cricetulus griseus]
MGGKQDENEAYGKSAKYDPSFRGPIKNRGCTDILCCVLFLLFILGYIVVGLVAWVYGDPRQVLYPRNSTGAYCGMGENKGKPYVLYFNIVNCIVAANVISVAQNGLQCPTPQVCVSSCPEAPWTVEGTDRSKTVGEVYKERRNFCLPEVSPDMPVEESLHRELCPRFLLPSAPALGRCFPSPNINATSPEYSWVNSTAVSEGVSGLLDSINARDISVKIFEDFARSWHWILVALGVALGLSLLFILLLRLVAAPLVLLLIVGVLAVLAYGIYHCWQQYRMLRDQGASVSQLGFTTNLSAYQSVQETWLAALIILAVLEGVLLLMLVFLRQRIRIAIALLKEASRAVGHMMSTMFYPLVTFVLLVICIGYWALMALYLATSGQPQYIYWVYNSTSGCENAPVNQSCDPMASMNSSCPGLKCVFQGYSSTGLAQRSLFNLQIYGILGLFWTVNWVLALGQCVLAGAFASFYWAFHKPRDIPAFPLSSAFIRTLRYHTGSLAFGALILTLVQIARIILEYIDHKLRGSQNPVARCIICCFKCCLWCLEKFIKFLNRNAYIMIAIYGKNFCVSAKNAFMLLMRNVVRVVVLDKVTDLLLFFGKLLVVGGVGVLSFFFFSGRVKGLGKDFENPQLNYYWLPIMTSIMGAYVIASGFFSVFGMCVDTLFLCFLEDLERNDGSQERPYYMPKALLKILGKKNEIPAAGKKRKK